MEAAVMDELRPAIEIAFHFARSEAGKADGQPVDPALKRLLEFSRLPTKALGIVRDVIDADDEFRQRVADEVTIADVGALGWAWLSRPDGWRDTLLAAEEDAVDRRRAEKAEGSAKAARKKLDKTDAKLATAEARARDLAERLDTVERALVASNEGSEDLHKRLADAEQERDHLRERAGDLDRRATRAEANLGEQRQRNKVLAEQLEDSTDQDRADQDGPSQNSRVAAAAVADALDKLSVAARMLDEAARVLPDVTDRVSQVRNRRRRPYRLGRGLLDDTPDGLEELMALSGVRVLVDGYNVAMDGWQGLQLELQRERLLIGLASTLVNGPCVVDVIFDGADVVTGERSSRSPNVRVGWSRSGVTADDLIVERISAISSECPVVVVTNDLELRQRSRDLGANIVGSRTLLNILV